MTGVVDVGVDVGTTHLKALAIDDAGQLRGRACRDAVWSHPRPEWTEFDPDTLLAAIAGVLDDLAAELGDLRCRSIGVTGMAETGVVLDDGGAVAHPPIAWHDPRGCDPATLGIVDDFEITTGLPLAPQASVFKLGWMREHGVGIAGGTWLTVPEFVVHRLGGARAAERSLAGRTGLVELRTGRPWAAPADRLEVSLPPIRAAGSSWGVADSALVPPSLHGAVLTVAGHDHAVAAHGAGAGRGSVYDSVGTAEALLVVLDALPDESGLRALTGAGFEIYPHVVEGQYAVVTGTRSGLALNRTLRLLGVHDVAGRDALDAAALEVGERRLPCRLDDEGLHLTLTHDDVEPAVLWRSAVAACADRMRSRVEVLGRITGEPVHRLVLGGGWSAVGSVVAERRGWAAEVVVSDAAQPGLIGSALWARAAAQQESPGAATSAKPHQESRTRREVVA